MNSKSTFSELKNFLFLWASQTVSSLGTAMTEYALVVWVYGQQGTASSVTILTLCTFLPTILFRFIAGTLTDRWNKKSIMLACDAFAACGTLMILVLHSLARLRIWHLYVINVLLSFMNAFQAPAAHVATSLLVPQKHYARTGGLQAFAGSAVSILAPALGSAFLAFGGLRLVLAFDLFSFAIAFSVLFFLIRVPESERNENEASKPFWQECTFGLLFLKEHKPLLKLILFMAVINFLAKIGGDGQMATFVLARTNGSHQALGLVQVAVSLGIMAGSLLMTWLKPASNRFAAIYLTCGLIFFGDLIQSLTVSVPIWTAAVFLAYLTAAVMNVHLTVLMREAVPVDLQGRVFSARDTLQNGCIPLGLLLGGPLVDHVFEPFMRASSPVQQWLAGFFGSGSGAGIALLFFVTGMAGAGMSFTALFLSLRRSKQH